MHHIRSARAPRASVIAVLASAAVLVASACAAPGTDGSGRAAPPVPGSSTATTDAATAPAATARTTDTSPTTTATTALPTTTAAAPDRRPSWAVATTRRTFVDGSRGRTLRTTIYYPAAGSAGPRAIGAAPAETEADAPPAAEPLPLVLMVHGYLLPGDGYDRLMKTVASAGYVVAAPEHPHTTGHGGDGQRSDLTNQPADLSFVADQVIALGPGAGVPAIRDPERLAVVGHSDGGLTATAFGYGQQFRDPRVVAVTSLTGGVGLFPGAFFTGTDLPAVLAVHARDDGTNPYGASSSLFRSVPAGRPRFLLTLETGDHIEPYMFGTGRIELGDAIAAFLDLAMANDPLARARLQHAASAPGMSLESAG